jgi:hypothetical protein
MNYSLSKWEAYLVHRQDCIVLIRLINRLDLKQHLKMCLGLRDVLPEYLEGANGGAVGHTIGKGVSGANALTWSNS